ncbi:MAG: gamma-glutamyltransferase family protein [Candidatus Bathyarchaeia archaeon]
MGTRGVVTSGHYLASAVGLKTMQGGGNAIDAGVAMGFALAVLEPHLNGIGGEVPILVWSAKTKRPVVISGQGVAPRKATVEWFRSSGIRLIPGDGFLPATVPGAFDGWLTALRLYGSLSLGDVLEPAVELARRGFPMYRGLRESIRMHEERFLREWPTTAEVFLSGGRPPEVGEVFRQEAWADTFERVLDEERRASTRGREAALQAARDFFYKGMVANRIVAFSSGTAVFDASGKAHRGLLELPDLAGYHAKVEAPVSYEYGGVVVHKCGPWSQGPVFLQQLSLLKGFDLRALGHNSSSYVHVVVEAAKLAFADRERFYGDPEFAQVPLARLLSDTYAGERRRLIDLEKASLEQRPGSLSSQGSDERYTTPSAGAPVGDTTHLDAVDAERNMVAATPSGGWIQSSPLIEGLGFPLGTRGQMFSLDPQHPNCLQPGKRPRTTLTPSLATRGGKPWMVFGTPGGDQQDQWTLQFFLNIVDFEMGLQEAIEAPTFHSTHFPSSFYPREAHPGTLHVEARISASVREELKAKGHTVVVDGEWSHGRVLAATIDEERGVLSAAASPRGETAYALGW